MYEVAGLEGHMPGPPRNSECAATLTLCAGCGTHTIKAGDTFWGLAQAKGFTVDAILAANPGVVPERLAVGQVVNLPCSGSGAAVNGNQATGKSFAVGDLAR
jgi:nucleoid-associated protein YgaU